MEKKIRPKGDRVLIQRDRRETMSAGGILLPDVGKRNKREHSNRGRVLTLGEGVQLKDGTLRSFAVSVGDTVFFRRQGAVEMDLSDEEKEFVFVREEDILAIESN